MVHSLRGHEPGSRGTSTIGSSVTEDAGLCVVVSCEIDASQRVQKPQNMETEEPLPGSA
jgi:hypothetical protein